MISCLLTVPPGFLNLARQKLRLKLFYTAVRHLPVPMSCLNSSVLFHSPAFSLERIPPPLNILSFIVHHYCIIADGQLMAYTNQRL